MKHNKITLNKNEITTWNKNKKMKWNKKKFEKDTYHCLSLFRVFISFNDRRNQQHKTDQQHQSSKLMPDRFQNSMYYYPIKRESNSEK